MTPQQVRENLPLYADGELAPDLARAIEAHLAAAPELRDELERWRALRRCARRAMMTPELPAGLANAIRGRLHRQKSVIRRYAWPLSGGVGAIAAAIVLLVLLWPGATTVAEPRLVSAERFAEIYRRCAVQHQHNTLAGVDLNDLDAVRCRIASCRTHPVLLPDLSGRGFRLSGVCECFREPGVRVVHASYRREAASQAPGPEVVSFFSVDQKVNLAQSQPLACPHRQRGQYQFAQFEDVVVCKWDELTNSFVVCSQTEADRLRELADEVNLALRIPAAPLPLAFAWLSCVDGGG